MACQNVCYLYEGRSSKFSNGMYAQGFKWCKMCDRWITCGGPKCPCCHKILRTRPRRSADSERLHSISGTGKRY